MYHKVIQKNVYFEVVVYSSALVERQRLRSVVVLGCTRPYFALVTPTFNCRMALACGVRSLLSRPQVASLWRQYPALGTASSSRCLSTTGTGSLSRRPLVVSELESYRRDGFVVVKNVYSQAEVDLLRETVLDDNMVKNNVMNMVDGSGRTSRLTLWRHAGE